MEASTTIPRHLQGCLDPELDLFGGPLPASEGNGKLDEVSGGVVRPVDHVVLDLLRRDPGLTVPELMDRLAVTATAVRQRLDRLVEMRLVERKKQSLGRGRPSFRHYLTTMGWREVGATYADLALAMWREIQSLPSGEFKTHFLKNVANRMGQTFRESLPTGDLESKMECMVSLLADRKVLASLDLQQSLPVLEMHVCPYPELADGEQDRSMCNFEKEIFGTALGKELQLSKCRLDGHSCCQFRPNDESQDQPEKEPS